MAVPIGILFAEPYYKPLGFFGQLLPNATMTFLRSGSAGPIQLPATVYQDAALTTPYVQPVTADSNGRFSPIYLVPGVVYRVSLFDQNGRRMQDDDPYVAQPPFFTSAVVKQADTVQSLNVVPTNDPDLHITIPSPGVYRFSLQLGFSITSTASNPNLKAAINFSSGMLNVSNPSQYVLITNVTGTQAVGNILGELVTNTNSPATGLAISYTLQNQDPTFNYLTLRGVINCQTPGILTLTWAQNTSMAATLTLRRGSSINVRQIQ